jgi:V8-like Glu-specific endopeptidase
MRPESGETGGAQEPGSSGRPRGSLEPGAGSQQPEAWDQPLRPRRFRWLAKPSARLVSTSVLAILAVIFATPADGGTGTLAARIAKVVGLASSPARTGQPFGGTPAVGALFTTSHGQLGTHFCTASVVSSPHGDLLVTAAHCITGKQGTLAFVPGYANGKAPYGTWYVSRVFTDQAWDTSASQDDDVAFLQVRQNSTSTPIEDITGAEDLGIGLPPVELTQVIGYPNGASEPMICQNWTKAFSATQLEFDCGGYPDGTSGGPFLVKVDQTSGQGTVMGVIGGYEQGGDDPAVSYAASFGRNISALYQKAEADS